MIDYDQMVEAVNDLAGYDSPPKGLRPVEVKKHYEFLNLDWEDYKQFVTERLELQGEFDESFANGFIIAATEFLPIGLLLGKSQSLDIELDEYDS